MEIKHLVFIDSRVSDYQLLLNGLPASSAWVLLRHDDNGIEQMARAASGYSKLESIQVISHGSPGALYLGNAVLDRSNLPDYQTQLESLGASLIDSGDILLYGCNVAQGLTGLSFVNELASIIRADVAASNNLTGKGGDWALEVATQAIETLSLEFSNYASSLETLYGSGANDYLGGTVFDDALFGLDGFDRLVGYVNSESRGDDYLDGGAGGDILSGNAYGSSTLIGGDGNDYIESYGGFSFSTGGADSDTFVLHQTALTDHYNLSITDFEVDKDQIDLTPIVTYGLSQYSGGNPFKASLGFLRIRQVDSDTLIECDRDGLSGSAFDWQTIFRLNNLAADTLTAANLNGYNPDGSPSFKTHTGAGADDYLGGTVFDDALFGLDGFDRLVGYVNSESRGDDYLDGGAGGDILSGNAYGSSTLIGGDGNDYIESYGGFSFATGGADSDSFVLHQTALTDHYNLTITDFEVGKDQIDLTLIVTNGLSQYSGGNPFKASLGFLRIRQVESDTLIECDRDGLSGSAFDWQTIFRLNNLAADTLTTANLNGYNPDGSPSFKTQTGAGADDYLGGTVFDDALFGLDGFDRLVGYVNSESRGDDYLDGGAGGDILSGNAYGSSTLIGGDGNDYIESYGGFSFSTGGADSDTFVLHQTALTDHYNLSITDFEVDKDQIDLSPIVTYGLSQYSGGNPFKAGLGFLRIRQVDSDTLIECDRDGLSGSAFDWQTIFRLNNLSADTLTAANLNGYNPDGSPSFKTQTGAGADDYLGGTVFDDALFGLEGFDRLSGYLNSESRGDDYLDGGAGGDILSGNAYGSSTLIGGDGNDYIESYGGFSFATGGADSDTFVLHQTALTDHYNLTITDFEVDKDQIDLSPIVTYGLSQYSGGNPFKASLGFLRIRQIDSDTLIECDRDGLSGSGFDWQTIFRLNNLSADTLTAPNLNGYNPDGSPSFKTHTGAATDDYLGGTVFDDALFGLDGFDRLVGYVNSESRGDDYLDGGAGGDILSGNAYGSSTLIGGDGNDYIESYGGFSFSTGGADSDTFVLHQTALTDHYNLTITDFEVGKDQIDLTPIVTYGLSQYSGGNPFKASLGFLRIRQVESDTLIECDRDGLSGSAFDWQTIFRLNDLTADSLGQNNFSGGLVVGTASNDTLSGGWTNDTINGGGGADLMEGEDGDDLYYVDDLGDVVMEIADEGAADTVIATIDYALADNLENLTLAEGAVIGTGNDLSNVIDGNTADNLLDGAVGADTLEGGLGADTLNGGEGSDSLAGGEGNDSLFSGAGNDYVDAGAGNDLIVGGDGAGDDTYLGGEGSDTLRYTSAVQTITVNLSNGRALGQDIGVDSLSSVENLIGGQTHDRIIGSAGANRIDAYLGSDTVSGGGGNDIFSFKASGNGVDTITDFLKGDVISIAGANLSGISEGNGSGVLQNKVQISSADGLTTLYIGTNGSAGADVTIKLVGVFTSDAFQLSGSKITAVKNSTISQNKYLFGSEEDNRLTGGSHGDVINGYQGNDVLTGAQGVDTVYGGSGNDTYVVNLTGAGGLEDSIRENSDAGIDTLQLAGTSGNSTAVKITLASTMENLNAYNTGNSKLNLTGNQADNLIKGNAANNVIVGAAGNDSLYGHEGNDTLMGGEGKDFLVGGAGDDVYDFNSLQEMGINRLTCDVISGFSSGDKIDLSTLDANTTVSNNQAFNNEITFGNGFSGKFSTGPGTLYFDTKNKVLYGNVDGDAASEFAIQILGAQTLTSMDVVF